MFRTSFAVVVFLWAFQMDAWTHSTPDDSPAKKGGVPTTSTPQDPRLKLFCTDPVAAICRGEKGKKEREAWNQRFAKENKFASPEANPKLTALREKLNRGGKDHPKEKDDAWWADYEKYAVAYFDQIQKEGGATQKQFKQIQEQIRATADNPHLKDKWEDAAYRAKRVSALKFITTGADITAIGNATDIKGNSLKRTVLKGFYDECEREGDGDNALNFRHEYVLLCPNRVARAAFRKKQLENPNAVPASLPFGLIKTLGHEIGHNLEFLVDQGFYKKMEACLLKHHPRPGSDNAVLFEHEFRPYMNEITSDYWGGIALAHAINGIEKGAVFELLEAEMGQMCDSPGTQWQFAPLVPNDGTVISNAGISDSGIRSHTIGLPGAGKDREPSHPAGIYRIRFVGTQPALRRALGCGTTQEELPNPPACAIEGVATPKTNY